MPVTEIVLVVTVPTGLHNELDTGLAVTVEVKVLPFIFQVLVSVQAGRDCPISVTGAGKVTVDIEASTRTVIPVPEVSIGVDPPGPVVDIHFHVPITLLVVCDGPLVPVESAPPPPQAESKSANAATVNLATLLELI